MSRNIDVVVARAFLAVPSLGLAHNLGGVPYQGIAAIAILGLL